VVNIARTGSAHTGLGEWLLQRLSGLYLAAYSIYLALFLNSAVLSDYSSWYMWISNGYVKTTLGLAFLSALVHAWIGIRSVFMDYLHAFWLRFFATSAVGAGLVVLLFWITQILIAVEAS